MPATRTWLAAAIVALAAFLLFRSTLLPGQDLGDTASFQATVGETEISPRQAYPLYYATGNLFFRAMPGNAARAINMASAVFGALACGVFTLVVAGLAGSVVGGIVAGSLLAVSYTFWSQAIIAEVYALHAFVVSLCMLLLGWWARRPSLWRLALFFAVYAVGFGNHLQSILLLPGFALFLLLSAPGGVRSMISPRVAALAVAIAALGASQYYWNLSYSLVAPNRPPFLELMRDFWFDVTKADWRAQMVMGIPEGALRDRVSMYWFDLHQQFGLMGIALAIAGLVWALWPGRLPGALGRLSRPRTGLALLALFLVNWYFAFTYNVGDAHVFYLPSHYFVAIFAGLGAAALVRLARKPAAASVVALALVGLPLWRGYDTYPALDRSNDWQVKKFFDTLTARTGATNSIFIADMNWQLHNGLDYYAKYTRPELCVADTYGTLLHFPLLVESNRQIGRSAVLTSGSAPVIASAYGNLYRIEPDMRVPAPTLTERVKRFANGTAYVFTFLAPYPDMPVDEKDLAAAVAWLTGGTAHVSISANYNVIAGVVGQKPSLLVSRDVPFRVAGNAGTVPLDVRMECWLPADTIRRMGFGRVIVGHRPALTIDRGASFVAFTPHQDVAHVEYGWAILAPEPRCIIHSK